MDVLIFLAWGLWVAVYGQMPVRSGIVVGKDARIIGLGMMLMGLLALFVPPDFGMLYAGFEVACVAGVFFLAKGVPPDELKK